MELFGKPTINPFVFYSGKISGYIVWAVFAYSIIFNNFDGGSKYYHIKLTAYFLLALGSLFTIISLLHLGRSTRFGLPTKSTALKTKGIYRFSRNPMYVGFGLYTIASMIYTLNALVIVLGIFSMTVYHIIIINEEKFLLSRFGNDYQNYKKSVRRYL